MLFPAVLIDFPNSKVCLIGEWSIFLWSDRMSGVFLSLSDYFTNRSDNVRDRPELSTPELSTECWKRFKIPWPVYFRMLGIYLYVIMLGYCFFCFQEMIEAIREQLVMILHTSEGAKVTMLCLWHGTPKVRTSCTAHEGNCWLKFEYSIHCSC